MPARMGRRFKWSFVVACASAWGPRPYAARLRAPRLRAPVAAAVPVSQAAAVAAPATMRSLTRKVTAFGALFVASALLHAAEVAITTLYPWKVKELAAEEGPRSSFALLDRDITRVLTTILVATTLCTIGSTALYADVARSVCGGSARRLAYATAGLTALTLFFGELVPKALGVNNAERTARVLAPPINALALVFGPVSTAFARLSKAVLRGAGLSVGDDLATAVSAGELRLTVGGAATSGGIDDEEGTMIAGVLDLQETRVGEFMKPRVEVHALDRSASMVDLLRLVNATGHSRVPVYEEEIDRVVGVVNAKKLLKFLGRSARSESLRDANLTAFVEPTYFVPETMVAWKVLEEMRRRRLHMAIVVDERVPASFFRRPPREGRFL